MFYCSPTIFISTPRILKSWCRIFNCWGGNDEVTTNGINKIINFVFGK